MNAETTKPSVNTSGASAQDGKVNAAVPVKSKGLPTIAKVGIGCFIALVILGVILNVVFRILFSRIGVGLLQKGIESKTGMKIDVNENGGQLSIKDTKTGAGFNVGTSADIPADFPNDFPIYPGAAPKGSLSGSNKGDTKGFWVMLTTGDDVKKVEDYYTGNLPKQGWKVGQTLSMGGTVTMQVSKGGLGGAVIISRSGNDPETGINISLSPENSASGNTNTDSQTVPTIGTDETSE
jgi:hypothetical protein